MQMPTINATNFTIYVHDVSQYIFMSYLLKVTVRCGFGLFSAQFVNLLPPFIRTPVTWLVILLISIFMYTCILSAYILARETCLY